MANMDEMITRVDNGLTAARSADDAETAVAKLSKVLANEIQVYREDPAALEALADHLNQ